jgi:outer membrane protein, heavy metal efflux system
MNRAFNATFAIVLLALAGRTVSAEPVEVVSSLTLEQTVQAALRDNAQLHALRARSEAMAEKPVQERTLPNPMFTYSGMDSVDNGTWPDTNEKRFMLSQEFPWFGKLGLKGKIAEKDAETMRREFETMQRDVVMLVKENYFDLYGVQKMISVMRSEEDVLKRMIKIAETMYATGERTQQDVIKAQTELTMIKEKLLQLDQQETTLKAKLNLLLNRPADRPLGLAVTEPKDELALTSKQLFALAEKNRAEIKAAQAQVERNQADRQLMQKDFWPDFRLGVEYRYFNSAATDDMIMFTVGIGLPIWWTKYKAGVREAEKMIESSQAAREAAVKQTSFDVQDAWFKLQTARQTLDLYRKTLIPQAESRFDASEASYRTGKGDFMDLLESERFLLSARVMAATAEGNLGMQLARLERAIGTDLEKKK